MAYQRQLGYQYETSPRKLEPEYIPVENPYKKKKTSTGKKVNDVKKPKLKMKPKAKAVIYIFIGFAILFAISYRNSLITESFNEKEELKKNLSAIQKENEQLKINIEKDLNLNNIEQLAKETLGMQKLDNNQKVYVSLPTRDYVEPASEEVIIKEESSLWDKIINLLIK